MNNDVQQYTGYKGFMRFTVDLSWAKYKLRDISVCTVDPLPETKVVGID